MQSRTTFLKTRDGLHYTAAVHRNHEGLRIFYFIDKDGENSIKPYHIEIFNNPCNEEAVNNLARKWCDGERRLPHE